MGQTDPKPSKIIGLTGMYCAGKNYVGSILEAQGLPVLDVDKLGHRVLKTDSAAITERFGPAILGEDGAIDRHRLGALVFGKPAELAALEGIIHPVVNRLTDEWLASQKGPCVINAALLHRSSAFSRLDLILLVTAPWLTRMLRARKRDNLAWGELRRRFSSQREFIPQYLREKADIYKVKNRECFGLSSSRLQRQLEDRILGILSQAGMA